MNINIDEIKRKLTATYKKEIGDAKVDIKVTKDVATRAMKSIHNFFELKRCTPCSKYIGFWSSRRSWTVDGIVYCEACAKDNFKICEYCHKIIGRLRMVEGKNICNFCFEYNTFKCEECDVRKFNNHLRGYGNRYLCVRCCRIANRSFRGVNIGQRKASSKTFIKNPDRRYCGVEIECLNEYRNVNCFIRKELKELRFSQGRDGSLSSEMGVEFRSVPMNGDLLFDSIEEFGKVLNKKKYRVNSSCGLHIHLEVKQQLVFLKKLYLFYLRFEDMFFNMLPKSRRSSDYCERFKEYYKDTPEEIMEVKTLDEFKEMLYETSRYRREIRYHNNDKRYCWVNLHSIFYRGTLEIRSHSGTINPSKIINWIMIHERVLKFLDEKTLEEIGTMNVTKKGFLDIFPKSVQNYIKKRWETFIMFEEKDLRTRTPVYINAKSLGVLNGADPEDYGEE